MIIYLLGIFNPLQKPSLFWSTPFRTRIFSLFNVLFPLKIRPMCASVWYHWAPHIFDFLGSSFPPQPSSFLGGEPRRRFPRTSIALCIIYDSLRFFPLLSSAEPFFFSHPFFLDHFSVATKTRRSPAPPFSFYAFSSASCCPPHKSSFCPPSHWRAFAGKPWKKLKRPLLPLSCWFFSSFLDYSVLP